MLPYRLGTSRKLHDEFGLSVARVIAGGGPRVARITPALAREEMLRMGYLLPCEAHDESLSGEMFELFVGVDRNAALLHEADVPIEKMKTWEGLSMSFSKQDILQRWRCAKEVNGTVRTFLAARKFVGESASPSEMREAMFKYLSQDDGFLAVGAPLPKLHAGLVHAMQCYVLDPLNPSKRRASKA